MVGENSFRPPATLRGSGDLRATTERLVRELQGAVNSVRSNYLPLSGGTMEGDLQMGGNPIRSAKDFYAQTADDLIFRRGDGSIAFFFDDSANTFRFPSAGAIIAVRGPDGTASLPAWAFESDPDTGAHRISANVYGISTGGVNRIVVSSTNFSAGPVASETTGSAANVQIDSTSAQMKRSTSALKYKSRIQAADWLADIDLQPTKHWRKDEEMWRYGLIADWLAAQDPLLGEYNAEGEIENYDLRAVMAVVIAKVNRLEKATWANTI